MIDKTKFLTPKLPWNIKIELMTARDPLMKQIKDIVVSKGTPGTESEKWLEDLERAHLNSDVMIVTARTGRTLVGFQVLDPSTRCVAYSWVVEKFRDKGLGLRFFSSACTNLGTPRPHMVFHKEMKDEMSQAFKEMAENTVFNDPFYELNPSRSAPKEAA